MLSRIVRHRTWLFAACLAVLAACGLAALPQRNAEHASPAAIPENPPGTIYCCGWPWHDNRLWQMNVGDKSLHPLPEGVWGEPSRRLHQGHRWFVDVRPIEGRSYSDGGTRRELFAVRDDGKTVRLTNMPDLEPMPDSLRWLAHRADSMIAWIGRRWNPQGRIVEQGVYTTEVRFDGQGGIAGSSDPVGRPVVTVPLVALSDSDPWNRAPVPDMDWHDWSPDGRTIVFTSVHGRLRTAGLKTGEMRDLTAQPASEPTWSADGSVIVFRVRKPLGGIAIIPRDGGDFELIFGRSESGPFAVGQPRWSPSGNCVAFGYVSGRRQAPELPVKMDLKVVSMASAGLTSLPIDLPESLTPIAWR